MPSACVTGGNGFVASCLIKQLLEKGYSVNATVRDLGLISLLIMRQWMREFGRLAVFRADLEEEGSFDEAINGCDYVFLVAAPVNLTSDHPEEELIKPAVRGTLNVLRSCVKAKDSVKRVILTSSASAVSINKLEGVGLVMDEEAWSDLEFLTGEKPPTWGYAVSKVLVEKEATKYAAENGLSLVTVVPPPILGPTTGSDLPYSMLLGLSLLTGNEDMIHGLGMMQSLSGSISFVHVEDLCRAHIFVAENELAAGRYICCAANTSAPELARFLRMRFPQYPVPTDFNGLPAKAKLVLSSEKLAKAGFEYKYKEMEEIYADTVEFAEAIGFLESNASGLTHGEE
ncbi:anthocyanidin reductase ((2S)-flavan-3-ol-forming)-like isoform X2 [Zingiber officinale]|uniref:anthocyanidin reductase ((2S)-flavan-3-ol-forming)-like isoform X2 n=1 Tax=Zingiber officinale TaxID=94328 RepID=UPI001C4AE003|nr:anthocyanidin reductase ((2S)-flavan-3-ol-forming)-like isoform X2 [Zingiber officinale]